MVSVSGMVVAALVLVVALGGPLVWALWRNVRLVKELGDVREKYARAESHLENERAQTEIKLNAMQAAEEQALNAFKALAADALLRNNAAFLDLANQNLGQKEQAVASLVAPLQESLARYQKDVQALRSERAAAEGNLSANLKSLLEAKDRLAAETGKLAEALRTPQVRGRWGEEQLRRVVEIAGLVDYCDFQEQQSVDTEVGRLRPDMIVNLPQGRRIVVDSKAPAGAYLEALRVEDETERAALLRKHAEQTSAHVAALSHKTYWSQFDYTPEFVVMFLPGEMLFRVALEQDPSLMETAMRSKVILASPFTLVAVLKAVAYGWRQEKLLEEVDEVSKRGKELVERIGTLAGYLDDIRRGLGTAVGAYNKSIASLRSRVMPSARRFSDLAAVTGGEKELAELALVDESLDAAPDAPSPQGGKEAQG